MWRPKPGDYVYTDVFKGTYEVKIKILLFGEFNEKKGKGGAILLDLESSDDEEDLFDEWKNILVRESLAKSSLIKVRHTSKQAFFTKGKVMKFGNNFCLTRFL